ncbi:hypothetical protein AWB79_05034 [Caballeronia hypogeia]|uniref:Uncharacterized protein n=2 Tax=Caballeronia hypogeia TaxID=1777140 RepID=A0A158CAQ5_9BURK|nr:hypothetical protein AWB79_05034 [Caballeronia hypogeia]
MNATITSHQTAANGDPELHVFTFQVDGDGVPRSQQVTVRTARVLARELDNRTALDALMRAIASAQPSDYDALVGTRYEDT